MTIGEQDRAFFEEQVMSLLDPLYGAALRLSRNHDDAEDLVAETVRKAWTSLDGLADQGSFRAWLFRILTNTFIGERRKSRTASLEEAVAADDSEEAPEFSLFDRLHQPFLLWWGNPEQEFLSRVLRQDLQRALDALPESYRVVVVLSELEGFTYQEIAAMLEVPVGTVRSRLARGRSRLQQMLWEHSRGRGGGEASGQADNAEKAAREAP